MRGFSQLVGVILVHCLDECNKAKLNRRAYVKKLQSMLDERGVEEDASKLVDLLLED